MVSTVAQHRRPSWTTVFSPPWISPAGPRSFRIPTGYLTRCCPREHAGWTVPPWDQRKPHHLDVYAHLHTGLASAQRGFPPGCFSHPACSWTGRGTHDASHLFFSAISLSPPCSAVLRAGETLHLVHAFYSIAKGSWCQVIGYVAGGRYPLERACL